MLNTSDDSKRDDWLAWAIYFTVLLSSMVCLLLSKVYDTEWPIAAPFLKEMGFAGVISLIVIFTVERFSRKRHEKAANALVEKINYNLFHAVYNRYIPEKVFLEVEKCLMHNGVFRSGHEINYTIQNADESLGSNGSKYVQCLAQSRYTLCNITDGDIEHSVILKLELPINPELYEYCKIRSVCINNEELTPASIISATNSTDAQVVFTYPVKIQAGGSIEVSTSSSLLKQRTDSEIWTSRLPSDGLKLTVSMPGKDLKVSAIALHSEKLVTILDNEVTKSWALRHGIFPFQSVVFWWHG